MCVHVCAHVYVCVCIGNNIDVVIELASYKTTRT